MWDRVKGTALAVAVVDVIALVSLVVFFIVGGPFGAVNDVSNAALGALSVLLAWQLHPMAGSAWAGWLGAVAATFGGAVMTIGSVLIIADITGWYLAGLVSAAGAALIGLWLVAANRSHSRLRRLPGGVSRLGQAAGIVMLLGALAFPGVVTGVDDWELAPWYVAVGQLSWLGTYILYPVWCVRLAALVDDSTSIGHASASVK